MRQWILAVAALAGFCVLPAQASYFRVMQPMDEVKSGAFVKLGTPNDNVSYGFQTTIIKHTAADGYLLLPGASWSLLDVGAAKTNNGRLMAVLGPSVDLSEPVKAVLLSGVRHLWPSSMGAVKALLAPAVEGKACLAASIGPGFALDVTDRTQGAAVIHAGLSAKW